MSISPAHVAPLESLPQRPIKPVGAEPSLPRPLTSFVGREQEVASVRALLDRPSVRMLTLTGPGGVGKTRLAMRVAEDLTSFPDGLWYVALAPVRDPALVGLTIAQALGIQLAAGEPVEQAISAFLADRRALLILDNFEHMLSAGPLIAALLQACPSLSVLVTTRAVLRVSGEHVFAVPPLALPDPGPLPPLDRLGESEAVRLFVERAAASTSSFALATDNAAAVVEICRQLDGLPLAIELAAARVSAFSPTTLRRRLDERLALLTDGPRDQPPRLQSMRDAIAWSHDLLDPDEQALFRRLAVFVGGWTFDAAEAIGGDGGERGKGGKENRSRFPFPPNPLSPPSPLLSLSSPSVLETLASLVSKSLVQREPESTGEGATSPRYRMLETIREFGLEQLAASGEAEKICRRHAAFFATLAEQAEASPLHGSGRWIERLVADHGNLRAALAWAIESGATETALRFVGALRPFWYVRGEFIEGRSWTERALAMDGVAPPSVRINALETASQQAEVLGDIAQAIARGEEGLALARSCDDQVAVGRMLLRRGETLQNQEHYDRAQAYLTQALAVFRGMDDPNRVACVVRELAWGALRRGDDTEAERWAEEALTLERAHVIKPWGMADTLMIVAEIARRRGDTDRAARSVRENLTIHWREGHRFDIMWRLYAIAVRAADQAPDQAARLFGAAAALRDEFGVPLATSQEDYYDPAVAQVRAALGESAFAAAWAAGWALPLEAAVAEALAAVPEPVALASPAACSHPHGLTPRELEVLRLLADGKTDQQIAAALFISRRTAASHARHIYDKLDVTSRAAASAYAVRHGLA